MAVRARRCLSGRQAGPLASIAFTEDLRWQRVVYFTCLNSLPPSAAERAGLSVLHLLDVFSYLADMHVCTPLGRGLAERNEARADEAADEAAGAVLQANGMRWRELAQDRAAALERNQAPQAITSRMWPRCPMGVTHASWPHMCRVRVHLGLVFQPKSSAPCCFRRGLGQTRFEYRTCS
jgi:hypothetical protein